MGEEPHAESAKNAENPSARARKGDGGREDKTPQKAFFTTTKRGSVGKRDENRTGVSKGGFWPRISPLAGALVAPGFTVGSRGFPVIRRGESSPAPAERSPPLSERSAERGERSPPRGERSLEPAERSPPRSERSPGRGERSPLRSERSPEPGGRLILGALPDVYARLPTVNARRPKVRERPPDGNAGFREGIKLLA